MIVLFELLQIGDYMSSSSDGNGVTVAFLFAAFTMAGICLIITTGLQGENDSKQSATASSQPQASATPQKTALNEPVSRVVIAKAMGLESGSTYRAQILGHAGGEVSIFLQQKDKPAIGIAVPIAKLSTPELAEGILPTVSITLTDDKLEPDQVRRLCPGFTGEPRCPDASPDILAKNLQEVVNGHIASATIWMSRTDNERAFGKK